MNNLTPDNETSELQISGISRDNTVTVRNLLIALLVISIIVISFFGYYFERGQLPIQPLPLTIQQPPHFLLNIYKGNNTLSHPIYSAVDRSGKIYVANNNAHSIEVFKANGKPEISIGQQGSTPGQLFYPYGVGILPDGNLLVAETGNYRIQEFTPAGKYIKTFIGQPNKFGLEKPGPVYVDTKGRIYIGDLSGRQVLILDQTGRVIRKIGNIQYPHGIAVDEKRNLVYVTDAADISVKVFSLQYDDKRPVRVIKTWETGNRFTMVRGLTVDGQGRLYVSDTVSSSIRVFDAEGKYLFSFGDQGSEDGQFVYPNGICVDNKGRIYVADWGNNRVTIWGY